jgi:tRNA (guanine37-N1)-methyltransferase
VATEFVVLTIFPGMFPGPLAYGVVGRALARGGFGLTVRDLRDWADPPHRVVDDAPFGGGAGMVLKPEPLFEAVEELRATAPAGARTRAVLLDPGGRKFDQEVAREYAALDRLILVCGRYEGVDGRVRTHLVDEEVSIGDYVLSGGEMPAMAIVEATARLIPGVVGEPASVVAESFEGAALDYPHYTRPAEFRGLRVPEVLLGGHHAEIEAWRQAAARERTRAQRPDLLSAGSSRALGVDSPRAARPGGRAGRDEAEGR